MPAKCEIITIGDEILIGQIVDTNSAWLGQELNEIGIEVTRINSIADRSPAIQSTLREAMERASLVLITGGLGPTKDDVTKKALADFFGVELTRRPEVVDRLDEIFKQRGRELKEINLTQADIPANASVLNNAKGTAPGMLFKEQGVWVVSMPGVPYEMKIIFEQALKPLLQEAFHEGEILHHVLHIPGIPESVLALKLSEIEDNMPEGISLAYLPSPGLVRLRVTGRSQDTSSGIHQRLSEVVAQIKATLGEAISAEGNTTLAQELLNTSTRYGKKFALAESCTGGYIAHLLTEHSGASQSFLGSSVVYSYPSKAEFLGVFPEALEAHGAVSEEVVRAMAQGALSRNRCDYTLAVSGIAGPDGGTAEKPVGTVWAAVSSERETIARLFHFGPNRDVNIRMTAMLGLDFLRREMIRQEEAKRQEQAR